MQKEKPYIIKNLIRLGLYIFISLQFIACSTTKYIPDGKYLLEKNEVKIDQGGIDPNELKSYQKQQPNKTILGYKFHLRLYNLSNLKKDKWPNGWLRKIGEEPVVLDPFQTESTIQQFKFYLQNKGYYNATISDTLVAKKKKAKVIYDITLNKPYKIRDINYYFEDTTLRALILADTINSLLETNMVFNKEVLQQERIRLENYLKNQGYYKFSKEYIYYEARKIPENNLVDLLLGIKKYITDNQGTSSNSVPHKKYKIDKVFVYPDFKSSLSLTGSENLYSYNDTSYQNGLYFIYNQSLKIKPTVISQINYIVENDQYSLNNVNKTYRNLSTIGLFKLVNINFSDTRNNADTLNSNFLNCNIELTRRKVQLYQFEVVGTNSSGDYGARTNLLYSNWNLFRGAEVFRVKFTGAIEGIKNRYDSELSNMHDLGIESRIEIPKFLIPFSPAGFVKRYNPKTIIATSYNYQSLPDYTRNIASASYGYFWRSSERLNHTVIPFDLNFVKIPFIDSTFKSKIDTTYLKSSFDPHLVLGSRYSFEFSNQQIEKRKDFVYIKMNVEASGNLMYMFSRATNMSKSDNIYQFLGVPYFQYVKADVDFRHYNVLDKDSRLVYRFFTGVGYPYGNSVALPFEKKYFSGGPNSIRAWSTRGLGPGSFEGDSLKYANYTGDIKIEGNIEYRFLILWKLEGALFLDVGNIWSIRKEDERPGAMFEWNKFVKDLAVGGGLGARFDFSYLLIRFDFGLKLRDPSIVGQKWVLYNNELNKNYRLFTFQFGIGYPF
ncbi:MAG: BamA/TamA family outer membrane protein [Bacteroidales bacterium]|nr:BamA/TamA family outer membrane protein [Bacteroidales bacterium]